MKKKAGILITVLVLIGIFMYNKMTTKEGNYEIEWSEVENAYQRRADLIPNLVSTVKGYADFEKETLESVIKARSEATKTQINIDNLSPETMEKFQQAQDGLSSALSRLLLTVERYPELKANQNFLELQSQLEGTENRIAVARRKYNQTAGEFNIYIRKFPMNILSSVFGFDEAALFKSDEGSNQVPKVEF